MGTTSTNGQQIVVTDTLPYMLNFVSTGAGGSGWNCSANGAIITCATTANLEPGQAAPIITIPVQAVRAGTWINLATVEGGNEPNSATANNTATVPVVVIAPTNDPDIAIVKTQTIEGEFTVGNYYTYTIKVHNHGPVATSGAITVTDELPNLFTFSATNSGGNGWDCTAKGKKVICSNDIVLNNGDYAPDLMIEVFATTEGTAENVAIVRVPNEPQSNWSDNTSDPPVRTVVGRAAKVSGVVWLDANHDHIHQHNEPTMPGFKVELLCETRYATPIGGCKKDRSRLATRTTGDSDQYSVIRVTPNPTLADGAYLFDNIPPGSGYALRFRYAVTGEPVLGSPVDGEYGQQVSHAAVSLGMISDLEFVEDDNIVEQSLAIQPNGTVYNALTREPVANIPITLHGPTGFDAAIHTVGGTANMTTDSGGNYQFIMVRDAPAGEYTISIAASSYQFPSKLLPVGPALVRPTQNYLTLHRVQPNVTPPTANEDTTYYVRMILDPSVDPPVVNNHIPVDVINATEVNGLVINKTASRNTVELGDFLDYSITLQNLTKVDLHDVYIQDLLPFGFTYVKGSARLDSKPLAIEPVPNSRMDFAIGNLDKDSSTTLTYRVRIGPNSMQGNGTNRAYAWGRDKDGKLYQSNVAHAKVKIQAGVFTEDAFVIGKVFLDCNRNRVQDKDELGIPGVKLVLETGVAVTTDEEGKYSLYGLSARTHVLRLDTTTLPLGARLYPISRRNAGRADSRFLDLSKGELHKANFAVRSCTRSLIRRISNIKKQLLATGGQDEASRTLQSNFNYEPNTTYNLDTRGQPAAGTVGSNLGTNTQPDNQQGFNAVIPDGPPIAPLAAPTPSLGASAPPPKLPIEDMLPNMDNQLAFIGLNDHDTLPFPQTNVVIKGVAGGKLQLTVNGEVIPPSRVGRKMLISAKQLEAWEYIGVNLRPGTNTLIAQQLDPFGNIRGTVQISLIAPDQLGIIRLDVTDTPYADGKTPISVKVKLTDHNNVPVTVRTPLTLESTLGRWQVEDLNPKEPGVQVFLIGGTGEYLLIPPDQAGESKLRVSSGILVAEQRMVFLSPLRPMIGAGVIEGAIRLSNLDLRRLTPARRRDGFQQEITQFAFGAGNKTSGGIRGALYLKGKVKGSYLLTLAYDSEKTTKDRLFRDIQPDEYYPVYGDSSVRSFDAQSNSRLYVKVERGRSFILYGDYTTQSDDKARSLSQYNRSLTGIKHHYENRWIRSNVFASKDSARQVIHEFPSNGTSGPFYLPFSGHMVINSEQIEVITRDRNQPSVIINTEAKQRNIDYRIDSFTGRILFNAPIPSRDGYLNPIYIKATYEVDPGGVTFWIYGFDVQTKVTKWLEIGGVAVKDENLENPSTLTGINATVRLGTKTFVTGEFAQTKNQLSGTGHGERVELNHESSKVQARVYAGRTSAGFDNPSASLNKGRSEVSGKINYNLAPSWNLVSEILYTGDSVTGGNRRGVLASVEHVFKNNVKVEVGMRHSQETLTAADPSTGTQVNSDLDTARVKITTPVPYLPEAQIYSEYEHDLHGTNRQLLALGGEYRFASRSRLYARHEVISGVSGAYALNTTSDSNRTTIIGLETDYMEGGQLFSEYRGPSAFGGYEPEAAIGLRNQFTLRPGLVLNASLERVQSLSKRSSTNLNSPAPELGTVQQANYSGATGSEDSTAVTAGIEYTANKNWKGSARIELRDAATSSSILNSLALAWRISPGWTFLGRSIYAYTDNVNSTDTDQRRLQLGFAYRDPEEDFWNFLARYEYRLDKSGTGSSVATSGTTITNIVSAIESAIERRVDVLSMHVNYQPSSKLILSGRYAFKHVIDNSNGITSTGNGHLIGARITRDIAQNWDVGLQGYYMLDDLSGYKYGLGVDVGYLVTTNLWLSIGYNVFGFKDRDFDDLGNTDQGVYLQLRYKFDERELRQIYNWE